MNNSPSSIQDEASSQNKSNEMIDQSSIIGNLIYPMLLRCFYSLINPM